MTSNGYEARQAYAHLVVPLDGSERSERALDHGTRLAAASGAQLHLLHVSGERDGDDGAAARIDELAAPRGAVSAVRPVSGRSAGAVIDAYLNELGNATAVMATHGRGRVASALMGSVTSEVVKLGHPVVALGPEVPAEPVAVQRVLACVDATSFSEQVVSEAAGWARALGASLWMIEVVSPSAAAAVPDGRESAYVSRIAHEVRGTGLDLEWEVLHDEHPGRAIAGYAASGVGTMIALATHGRAGLRRAMVGSVAGDVLRSSACPVVLLQPSS
jgi:nucleotide-binding universal stress UspA family protein